MRTPALVAQLFPFAVISVVPAETLISTSHEAGDIAVPNTHTATDGAVREQASEASKEAEHVPLG